ncbi:hypothetical protein L1785_22275 [Antribacter sp. KLBMP9083]|uniref:Uncharacterized protein n=1 Tax=Antribacter soli TaxID=2910976 RepID=A0AA41U9D4_9MICO|nr:hypothetical protein [Antribacter soli]MCF4123691.1 hypothetical protein [Antribacter soli]
MSTEEELDRAGADAMKGHDRHDAYAGNAVLAEKLWGALRGLGVERGRMLVMGDHASVHAGLSAKGKVSKSIYEEWVAPIPPAGADGRFPWPHDMLRPRSFTDDDPATHDVVIANMPWSDLHYRSEYGQARLQQIHAQYPADEPFDIVLHHVLSRIVRHSLAEGLTAVSASWHPPEARLAPEADRSVRAQGAKAPSGPTTTRRTGPTDAPNL